MKPHELKPAPGSNKKSKRIGRGVGSGRGGSSGRGTKGSRARGEVHAFFEGGQMPLIRRLPKLKGFTPPNRKRFSVVNLDDLGSLEGDTLGPDEMRAAGLIRKRDEHIKVLGSGSIERKVTVRADAFSDSARSKIEAAGGTIELVVDRRAKE